MANENIAYGVNLTADQMKKNLATIQRNQKGVRTWDQILGASSVGYQQQQSALTQQYGDAITEAYKTYLGGKEQIAGLGLSDEQRTNQFGLSQADLENTYKTYIANYAEKAQTLADAYNKNVTAIDEALTDEAEGYVNTFNTMFDYLDFIYSGTSENENPDNKDEKIIKNLKDEYLSNYLYSKEDADNKLGEEGKLKSRNELMSMFFDEEGRITTDGIEFLDKMLNVDYSGYFNEEGKALRNFDTWLSETNPKLRTFFAGADPYNYNVAGDRAGTFKELFGLKGNDYQYSFKEYGKYNLEEINTMNTRITEIDTKITDIDKEIAMWKRRQDIGDVYTDIKLTGKSKRGSSSGYMTIMARINQLEAEKEKLVTEKDYLNKEKVKH